MIVQNTTDLELIDAIKLSIKNKTPLSVVRCGDGEMHILKQAIDFPGNSSSLRITMHYVIYNSVKLFGHAQHIHHYNQVV